MEQSVSNKTAGKRIPYKLFAIVGLNGILALLAQIEPITPVGATIILFGLFLYIAIPSLIVSLICWLILEHRPTWRFLKLGRVCRFVGVWIILCLPTIPISMVISDYRLEATKKHCENLIPRLDEWRQQNGRYPTTLIEIGESNPSRWLLEFDYGPSEDRFTFSMTDPSAFFEFWIYESDKRQWFRDD